MDGQMVRIAQMKSSEDEDSDGSDGWSDGQDSSDEELIALFAEEGMLLCSLRVTRLGSVLFLWICGGCWITILRAIGV